jgi:DNA-binding MarR family transcriptional regulator
MKTPGEEQGSAPLGDVDYERLAEFRYILRQFLIFSEDAAAQAGLTAQQHQALLAIRGTPGRRPVTTGELAERLGIRHHSAVGLIDRLVAKALVVRHSGLDDRRQVHVALTAAAEAILATLSAAHREELARLAPMLRELIGHLEESAG